MKLWYPRGFCLKFNNAEDISNISNEHNIMTTRVVTSVFEKKPKTNKIVDFFVDQTAKPP